MLLDFIANAFENRATWTHAGHPRDPAIADMLGFGQASRSGIVVNEKTAMTHSAVWRAVNLNSMIMGDLPIGVYRRRPDGAKEQLSDHPTYKLLHDICNPELFLTAFARQQLSENHELTWGNECAWIERRRNGTPVALWPHPPNMVSLDATKNGRLFYTFKGIHEADKDYDPADVLHHRGMSPDGLWGWSRIRQARESIGQALAAQQFGAAWFGQGSRPGVIITTLPGFRPEDRKAMVESITQQVSGPENWHRPLVVPFADKIIPTTVPPEDAQFLGTQEWGVADAGRWFDTPLVFMMLQNAEPRANAEQDTLNFVTTNVAPKCRCKEQELSLKLLSDKERDDGIFIEHNLDALLRGDFKSRMEGYNLALNNGTYSRNEVRKKENLDPIPVEDGGDMRTVPVQSLNLKALVNQTEPPNSQPKDESEKEPAKDEKPVRSVDWLAVYEPLFDGATSHLLAKEEKGINGLIAKHGAEARFAPFYAGHDDAVRFVLKPIMLSMGDSEAAAVRGIAERYCDMAQREQWPAWKSGKAVEFMRGECRRAVAYFKGDDDGSKNGKPEQN